MTEAIPGDLLTAERRKIGDVEMKESDRGGVSFHTKQLPVDYYFSRKIIKPVEYGAAKKVYRDFYVSGQTMKLTVDLNAIRTGEHRAYLPATEAQREALDSWRKAMEAVKGKIGQLMILNVCCYGHWVNDIKYLPYDERGSILRFREALGDLVNYYFPEKKV